MQINGLFFGVCVVIITQWNLYVSPQFQRTQRQFYLCVPYVEDT